MIMKKIYEEPNLDILKFTFNSVLLVTSDPNEEEDLSNAGNGQIGGEDFDFG